MPALSKLLQKLHRKDDDGPSQSPQVAPGPSEPPQVPLPPISMEPTTTYYLSSLPGPSADGASSSLVQVPQDTLIFGFTHPPKSVTTVAFFLRCVPDPIAFLEKSAYFIYDLLSPLSPTSTESIGSPGQASSLEDQVERLRLGGSRQGYQWRHQHLHLMLKDEGGLAYTTEGKITISLQWVGHISSEVDRGLRDLKSAEKELKGVLLHELVHTIQHDGDHTLPGWLVESIADYVRLHAGLDPPHWRKPGQGRREKGWEDAYDAGARFLDWITGAGVAASEASEASLSSNANEVSRSAPSGPTPPSASATQYPSTSPAPIEVKPIPGKHRRPPLPHFVRDLDARLATEKWRDSLWTEMCGNPLEVLWKEYLDYYGVS